jgi:hypothetical protein
MTKDLLPSFKEATTDEKAPIDPYAALAARADNDHQIAEIASLRESGYSLSQIADILELNK